MKNHGLQVAKLSHFKSGPNISVSYVSFLHANYIFSFAICNNRKTAYLEVLAQLLEDHMVLTSVSRK